MSSNKVSKKGKKTNKITVFLVVMVALMAVLVVAQYFVFDAMGSELSQRRSKSEELQSEISFLESENNRLNSYFSGDMYIKWRNAQGRLSLSGDGSGKVAYLTFDDGPYEKNTRAHLQTLKEKGAVGTWFLLGNAEEYTYLNLSIAKDIEAQGSAVGIHDWDQDEKYLYYKGDTNNYFTSDFNKVKAALEKVVGHEIKICRFAGGSATVGYYNKSLKTELPRAVLNAGYQFFDWNVSAADAEARQFVNGSTPVNKIVDNVLTSAASYAASNSPICILMHDNPGKETTVQALPQIIDGLRAMGYTFDTLKYESPGFYQTVIAE